MVWRNAAPVLRDPPCDFCSMCPLDESFEELERVLFGDIIKRTKHCCHATPMQPTEYKAHKYDTCTLFCLQLVCSGEHQRNEGGHFRVLGALQEVNNCFLGQHCTQALQLHGKELIRETTALDLLDFLYGFSIGVRDNKHRPRRITL